MYDIKRNMQGDEPMAKGVIYILTNPSFPEYVKIGYAKDLEKRMNQLNRSETIPFAFRAYAVYEVESNLTDLVLHDLIDKLNPDLRSIENFDGKERKREFYAMSPEDAYSLLECIAKISGTENRLKKWLRKVMKFWMKKQQWRSQKRPKEDASNLVNMIFRLVQLFNILMMRQLKLL